MVTINQIATTCMTDNLRATIDGDQGKVHFYEVFNGRYAYSLCLTTGRNVTPKTSDGLNRLHNC